MLISVVIPTRNRFRALEKCLNALKKEIRESGSCEVIVSDDFSSERDRHVNSLLCREYGFRYVCQETKRGPAAARNAGLKISAGKWVVFIDDDVLVNSGWYKALTDIIGKADSSVCGIEGTVIASGRGLWDKEVSNLKGGLYLTSNIAYRKKVLTEINGFDEGFCGPHGEDQELALRMLKRGRIIYSEEISVTHMPRDIKYVKLLLNAPKKINAYLNCEYYFFMKHKDDYKKFRYHSSFWGTYRSLLFTHVVRTLKRRKSTQLIDNVFCLPVLLLSSIIETAAAWVLLPDFIKKTFDKSGRVKESNQRSVKKRVKEVWFAANIGCNEWGGVHRSVNELTRGLKNRGYKTRIIYSPQFLKKNYLYFSLYVFVRLLISRINPPDWIISRSSDGILCALFSAAGFIGTKTILYNHGWEKNVYKYEQKIPEHLITFPTTWKARLIRFPLLDLNIRLCDYCICGTVYEARLLKSKYPDLSYKVRYVPNGVNPEDKPVWISGRELPLNFLAVGGFTWKKNMDYTVKLFLKLKEDMPSAFLYLAGAGCSVPEQLRLFYSKEKSIRIIENLKPSDMKKLYLKCPFLISSSVYEGGHSLVILEAMSYGAAVFATKIFSTAEIIKDEKNGFFISGNDIGMDCGIIKKKISNSRVTHNVRKAACSTAKRNRWPRQVMRLEKLL